MGGPLGLSPRGRGNRCGVGTLIRAIGSIPAWAGEPGTRRSGLTLRWVYPRVGGGTVLLRAWDGAAAGLSPRGRGNRTVAMSPPALIGSIPAWAGEPSPPNSQDWQLWVYPRVGGGTVKILSRVWLIWAGLSPRGRGNPSRHSRRTGTKGLSPRGRGNHPGAIASNIGQGLSPRGRGNLTIKDGRLKHAIGLSPRGRGNQPEDLGTRSRSGSIPAWAGEPKLKVCGSYVLGLSPRGRGNRGNVRQSPRGPIGDLLACLGLSPRGRGNQAPAW